MSYAIVVTTPLAFDAAVEEVRTALADQGFGVLTEIDMTATLKQKIDADINPYMILGACRPPFAHETLKLEPHIGLLLPCNVVVRQLDDGQVEVSAIDPRFMVEATGNSELNEIALEAYTRINNAITSLAC